MVLFEAAFTFLVKQVSSLKRPPLANSFSIGWSFDTSVICAKFLLLRESGNPQASQIFKLKHGIRVFSKQRLEELGLSDLTKDNYLVYDFEVDSNEILEFKDSNWNFKDLKKYKETVRDKNIRTAAGIPFTTTLTELMGVLDK
tara:strand:- start:38 stop:466 length:429 start_codon:yes stop_codon:yes gene_type:complete